MSEIVSMVSGSRGIASLLALAAAFRLWGGAFGFGWRLERMWGFRRWKVYDTMSDLVALFCMACVCCPDAVKHAAVLIPLHVGLPIWFMLRVLSLLEYIVSKVPSGLVGGGYGPEQKVKLSPRTASGFLLISEQNRSRNRSTC